MAFIKARGENYLSFLAEMHDRLLPAWYLEVGTRHGDSLCKSRTHSIAIDPAFTLMHDVIQNKPSVLMYQQTSDDFYASDAMKNLGHKVDLAFLDGMHLFEFLLRDFYNTEKYMSKDGRIVLHDCMPWNNVMALRDWDQTQTSAWTGDVWKLVPILQKYRPDLTIDAYDCKPTGLVVISDLDPKSTVLKDNYDVIINEWMDVTLEEYGDTKYYDALRVKPAKSAPWRYEAKATVKSKHSLSFSIVTGAWSPRRMLTYGDYPFAKSLGEALERRGHTVRVDSRKTHAEDRPDVDIDLFIKGVDDFAPVASKTNLMWFIYGSGDLNLDEMRQMDHVFVASEPFTKTLGDQIGNHKVSTLLQAFDARTKFPCRTHQTSSFLFVGFNKRGGRRSVEWAMDDNLPLDIYGSRWQENPRAKAYLRGEHIDNAELRYYYANAAAVLNDHREDMARDGFVSNRIFDALACGAAVVTDHVESLPIEFLPWVYTFKDQASFREATHAAAQETAKHKAARIAFAQSEMQKHSFDARALEIERVALDHMGK